MDNARELGLGFAVRSEKARTGAAEVVRSLDDIRTKAKEVGASGKEMSDAFGKGVGAMRQGLALLGSSLAGLSLGAFVMQAIQVRSRYEELGLGMEVVAKNAGKTQREVTALEGALRKTGISALQARQSVLQVAQAQIDYADATKLARIAQDAAVVGQLDSSHALQRLLYGVQSAQVEVLRTIGINVSWEEGYRKLAQTLGKSQNALTQQEKSQARVNQVMEAGGKLAGLYERSMDSAGKQLRSTRRYVEDLQIEVARSFQPAYNAAVFGYANALKALAANAETVAFVISSVLSVSLLKLGSTAVGGAVSLFSRGMAGMRAAAIATGTTVQREAFESATALLRQARAEEKAAAAAIESALVARVSAQTTRQRRAAVGQLTAALELQASAEAQTAVAAKAAGVAQTQLAVATTAAAGATSRLALAGRGLLAMLGGPWGAAFVAATVAASYLMTRKEQLVKLGEQYGETLADEAAAVGAVYDAELKLAQLKAGKAPKTRDEAEAAREATKAMVEYRAELNRQYNTAQGGLFASQDEQQLGRQARSALTPGLRDLDRMPEALKQLAQLEATADAAGKALLAPIVEAAQGYVAAAVAAGKLDKAMLKVVETTQALGTQAEAAEGSLKGLTERLIAKQTELFVAQQHGVQGLAQYSSGLEVFQTLTGNAGATLQEYMAALKDTNNAQNTNARTAQTAATELARLEAGLGRVSASAKVTAKDIAAYVEKMDDMRFDVTPGVTASERLERSIAKMTKEAAEFGTKGRAAMAAYATAARDAFTAEQAQRLRAIVVAQNANLTAARNAVLVERELTAARKDGKRALEEATDRQAAYAEAQEAGLPPLATLVRASQLYTLTVAARSEQQARSALDTVEALEKEGEALAFTASLIGKTTEEVDRLTIAERVRQAVLENPALANHTAQLEAMMAANLRAERATGKLSAASRQAQESWLEAARGIQQTITGVIGDALNGSLRTVDAYADAVTNIFRNMAANILAAFVSKKLGITSLVEDIANGRTGGLSEGGLLAGRSALTRLGGGAFAGAAIGAQTNNPGLGLAGGAVAGFAAGGPVGAVAGAVTGLVSSLAQSGKRAAEEAKAFQDAMRSYARTMGEFRDTFVSPLTDFERQMKDVRRFASDRLREIGEMYKVHFAGLGETISPAQLRETANNNKIANSPASRAMLQLADDIEAAERRIAEERERGIAALRSEIEARVAAASGDEAAAEAIRRASRNAEEVRQAELAGYDAATIAMLQHAQALETVAAMEQRARDKAKAKQAFDNDLNVREATVRGDVTGASLAAIGAAFDAEYADAVDRLAAKAITKEDFDRLVGVMLAEQQQQVRAMQEQRSDDLEDLGVRRLAATGTAQEVDDARFRIAQERELSEALKDTSAEGVLYATTLREVLGLEKQQREELIAKARDAALADLDVRALVAQGMDEEAEAKQRQLDQQRELDGVTDEVVRARILEVQALEDIAWATEKANAERRKAFELELSGLSLDAREAAAGGNATLADEIRREIERRRELNEITDAETLARVKSIHAMEDEAIARERARMNEGTFASIQAEIYRLKGQEAEALKVEFAYKQAMFRDELEQKLLNKQITEETYQLGQDLLGLRSDAFAEQLANLVNQNRDVETVDGARFSAPGFESPYVVPSLTVSINVNGPINGMTGEEAGEEIAAPVVTAINNALGRAAGIERRRQGRV